MPVHLGDKSITGMALGDKQAEKVYHGASLVLGGAEYQNVLGESPTYEQSVPTTLYNKAKLCMVGGNSMKWNQLTNKYNETRTIAGVTVTLNENGSINVHGTYDGTNAYNQLILATKTTYKRDGTKYLFLASKDVGFAFGLNGYTPVTNNGEYFFFSDTAGTDWSGCAIIRCQNAGDKIDIDNVFIWSFDLTQIFGSGNEPTSIIDSRIEWLKQYASEHPQYDKGSIIHADCQSVVSSCKNLCSGFNKAHHSDNIRYTDTEVIYKGGTYIDTYWRMKLAEPLVAGTTISVSFKVRGATNPIGDLCFARNSYKGSVLRRMSFNRNGTYSFTVTIPDGDDLIELDQDDGGKIRSDTDVTFYDWQIEKSSTTTPYTPYREPIAYQLPYIEQDSWGIGDVYNERNFKEGKRVQRVAKNADGELYVLDTPIETPLAQPPITLSVEEGGTVTFENTPKLEIPNETVYKVPLDTLEAQITVLYNNDVKEISNL